MRKSYYIYFIIITFLIFVPYVSADRLPVEVPENQRFTLDTLIDSTGIISEESKLDWTIASINIAGTEVRYAGKRPYYKDAVEISAGLLDKLANKYWIYGFRFDRRGVLHYPSEEITWYLTYFRVPDSLINEPININGYHTFGSFLDSLIADQNYSSDSFHEGGEIHDGMLDLNEEISILSWTDSLRSNGGKVSLNKNIEFDSQNKGRYLSNLKVEKVLTYVSTEGAHLIGSEKWSLDTAGNADAIKNGIRCVFSSNADDHLPEFCNIVKAKSELVNINHAQISSRGSARSVAGTYDIPAGLAYEIAVTPDSNSGSGIADGTVKTLLSGSIMEAGEDTYSLSATNNWKDSTMVTGQINNFQKTFNYESGFKF